MYKRMAIWLAAVLAALCLSPAAMAEGAAFAVHLESGALLVKADGDAVTNEGEYFSLYEIDCTEEGIRLYAGEKNGAYALVNDDGEALTDFVLQSLEYAHGKIIFAKGGRMGVMDLSGNILVQPAYTGLISCGDGGYLAQKTDPYDDSPDAVYRIGPDGAEQASGVLITGGLHGMSEGRCPAASADNGLYGYLDTQGKWAVEPAFEWAGSYAGYRAAAGGEKGMGLISETGEWLFEPEYEYLSYEEGGLAVCGEGDVIRVLDPGTGALIAEYAGEGVYGHSASGGAAVVTLNGRTAVVNASGEEVFFLEDCRFFGQWAGMDGYAIAGTGTLENGGAALYRMDGTRLSEFYRDLMPLGMKDGGMHYVFTQYDVTETAYPELGVSLWDAVPGTYRCGVLSPDGAELCRFEAEYLSCVGEDRMLIDMENGPVFADFAGTVIRDFGAAEDGAE
ncbi:MAG: WG repeat-containing protein [Clostridia bacterium]|nr:WG repeat-containing protein [Clostridia bacterium]